MIDLKQYVDNKQNIKVLYFDYRKCVNSYDNALVGVSFKANKCMSNNMLAVQGVIIAGPEQFAEESQKLIADTMALDDVMQSDKVYGYIDNNNVLHTRDQFNGKKYKLDKTYDGTKVIVNNKIDTEPMYIVVTKDGKYVSCSNCNTIFADASAVVEIDGSLYCFDCINDLELKDKVDPKVYRILALSSLSN